MEVAVCVGVETHTLCAQHLHRHVEFYCRDHDVFFCGMCFDTDKQHVRCSKDADLGATGTRLVASGLDRTLLGDVRGIMEHCDRVKASIELGLNTMKMQKANITRDFDTLRNRALEIINEQERMVIDEFEACLKKKAGIFRTAVDQVQQVHGALYKSMAYLEQAVGLTPEAVFPAMTAIVEQNEAHRERMEMVAKDMTITNFVLYNRDIGTIGLNCTQEPMAFPAVPEVMTSTRQLKSFIETRLNTADNPGYRGSDELASPNTDSCNEPGVKLKRTSEICISNDVYDEKDKIAFPITSWRTKEQEASLASDIVCDASDNGHQLEVTMPTVDVEHADTYEVHFPVETDVHVRWIDDIVCLPNCRYLLSEPCDNRLILCSDNLSVLSHKHLQITPGKMTAMTTEKVLVCAKGQNRILAFHVDDDSNIKRISYFSFAWHPKCISAVSSTDFVVTLESGYKTWRVVQMRESNQGQFTQVREITRSILNGYNIRCVGVTDGVPSLLECREEKRDVICFDADANEVFCHSFDEPKCSVCDSHGFIYIIGFSGEIRALTSDGTLVLRKYFHAISKATAVTYNKERDSLLIVRYKEPVIYEMSIVRKL